MDKGLVPKRGGDCKLTAQQVKQKLVKINQKGV